MTKLEQLIKLSKSVNFKSDEIIAMYGGVNEYYTKDKAQFNNAKRNIKNILKYYTPTDEELVEASKNAFSGRLEYVDGEWIYSAGQFYDLELPQAISVVLDYARVKSGVFKK